MSLAERTELKYEYNLIEDLLESYKYLYLYKYIFV